MKERLEGSKREGRRKGRLGVSRGGDGDEEGGKGGMNVERNEGSGREGEREAGELQGERSTISTNVTHTHTQRE